MGKEIKHSIAHISGQIFFLYMYLIISYRRQFLLHSLDKYNVILIVSARPSDTCTQATDMNENHPSICGLYNDMVNMNLKMLVSNKVLYVLSYNDIVY